MAAPPTYAAYRDALKGRLLPAAFVDLDGFDANVAAIARRAGSKPVRVATKSVRCVALLRRILAASDAYRGLMAYHPLEAIHLAASGFDDVLIAYPFWHPDLVERLMDSIAEGRAITAMVDSEAHVAHLGAIAASRGLELPLCLDLDMSSHYPGLHFGVRRSGITTPEQALALAERIRQTAGVRLDGLMGYEAQIAGLPDAGSGPKSAAIRVLKARSRREVGDRRQRVVHALAGAGHALRFVNGGGTGSMESTAAEEVVTEIAAGSGFFAPTLFDGYTGFKHLPAAAYAIEITRRPAPGLYTCSGGGYPASGAVDKNKAPSVYLPEGATLLEQEGAGEVQTPVAYAGPETLNLGDPILMRHAKAGELCERFNTLLLIQSGQVVDEVRTYRGEGHAYM
ncbi:MAG: amino acid deaminase/aldolase [Candidatus Sericytochromatia bacterium]